MRNKKSVIFMGTPDFAVPSLEKIHKEYHLLSVYTQPPKKSGRGLRTKLNPIHEISNDYNLPIKTPQNFKSFDKNVTNGEFLYKNLTSLGHLTKLTKIQNFT